MLKTFAFILILSPAFCFAQDDSTVSKNILQKFAKYSQAHVTEKAYLHFDKPYYAAGDTLYFKAYVTLGSTNKLSALSGVLHVDLIDNLSGKILQHEKLAITNGVTWGDMVLPDSLTNDNCRVRAYTRLMQNGDKPTFFEQNIALAPVAKAKNTVNTPVRVNPAGKPDMQFFPEGGTLVVGIKTRMAYKAINTNGLGTPVVGVIRDNNNKLVCNINSAHLGMGYFYLAPEAGKTYKAYVVYGNGSRDTVSLPTAMENGIALSGIQDDSTLVATAKIDASPAYFTNNKGKTFLLNVYSGGIMTSIPCRLDSTSLSVYLYKKKLHMGITRLTLFSPTGEPLCERLLFINNHSLLNLTVDTENPVYTKRQKVTISLKALTTNDLPVSGDFSVAVTNETKLPPDTNSESTILNNLLLTSELKGNIEQPNYYFNKTPEAFTDLDILMLTQGYRAFAWQQVLNDTSQTPKYAPEKLLSISGTVQNLSGKPVSNAEVNLGAIKQLIAKDTIADVNGRFRFNDLDISDTTKILLRGAKGRKDSKIIIDKPDEPLVNQLIPADTAETAKIINPAIAAEMKQAYQQKGNMRTGIVLKQVNIHEDKNPEHLVPLLHSDNLNGAGRANQVIMGDQLFGCASTGIAECLASLLHGVRLVYPGPVIYSIRTPIALSGRTKPMAVMLNGIITDQSALSNIAASDIYSIEVLQSLSYLTVYGSQASGGLLVITTRRGDERSNVNVQPGLTTYTFAGFYKARQFYSPKYDVHTPVNTIPDLRTTILWKPVVLTDKNGDASFDLYNGDIPGNYRVVVEGIDGNGNLGRVVYHYKVQ